MSKAHSVSRSQRVTSVSIRWLLLGVNAVVLFVPVLALLTLRVYDTYLMRQTERQLIAKSIIIGEAWREGWLREVGRTRQNPGRFRPPNRERQRFIPIEPHIDLLADVAPPIEETLRQAPAMDNQASRAGRAVQPLLRRSQVFHLSAVRVLDQNGCVVATTGGHSGRCLDALPEVKQALAGKYASIARRRIVENPPPLGDIRRRGTVRIYTALPVFDDGQVVAVVYMSRTSLDALTSLWFNRRGLFVALMASLVITILLSLFFSSAIARPVRAITAAAKAIALGQPRKPLTSGGWVPSEISALSRSLDTMTERLSERAEYVATFASNVSHELKTPITAIRGAAELLQEQWQQMDAAQRQRFVSNIDNDAARMERLVTRLLDLARIENAVPDSQEPLHIDSFLKSITERYGERVQLLLEDAPDKVEISPDHLASAVNNLVENALRHARKGPVVVRVGQRQNRLFISVSDDGEGISPANQKRLFQRFFTTQRDSGGTGLGLAIVKAVAESRGGWVDYETGPEGSSFHVLL